MIPHNRQIEQTHINMMHREHTHRHKMQEEQFSEQFHSVSVKGGGLGAQTECQLNKGVKGHTAFLLHKVNT